MSRVRRPCRSESAGRRVFFTEPRENRGVGRYDDPVNRDLPDVRDGLTHKERIVLWVLAKTQAERGDRHVPTTMLYGRVVEHVDMSMGELVAIVARLGARRP